MPSHGLRASEVKAHATIAAVVMWIAGLTMLLTPYVSAITGPAPGDFIHFYTMAHIAFEGPYPRATGDDFARLHTRQVELLPASDSARYLPFYPPTMVFPFVPVSRLPFATAQRAWAAISIVGYAVIVWLIWRTYRAVLPDGVFVAAVAAAFPPFWSLAISGQTTVIPLVAFCAGWFCLRASRPILAGVAFGVLALKPQWGLVLAAVVLLTGQWRILLGIGLSVAAQVLAVMAVFGTQAWLAYAFTVSRAGRFDEMLTPEPWRMHSIKTVTDLLPAPFGMVLWAALSMLVIGVVVWRWRSGVSLDQRMALLVLGSVLVNPHLYVYDATVLALPLLWIGAEVEATRPAWRRIYWHMVYALCVLLLVPSAQLIGVQVSVAIMGWLLWRVATWNEAAQSVSSATIPA